VVGGSLKLAGAVAIAAYLADIQVARGFLGISFVIGTGLLPVEVSWLGEPLGEARRCTIDGRVAYVDALVIKFDDEFVEQGDALRGTSLCLFRRLFGEYQFPSEGFPLDTEGQRPLPYAADDADPGFETRLWTKFWDYAHDPDAVAAAGVRAMHGEAPYMELRPGKTYRVELRASGGLSVEPE